MDSLSPEMEAFYKMVSNPTNKAVFKKLIGSMSTIEDVRNLCVYHDWIKRHNLVKFFKSKVKMLDCGREIWGEIRTRFCAEQQEPEIA